MDGCFCLCINAKKKITTKKKKSIIRPSIYRSIRRIAFFYSISVHRYALVYKNLLQCSSPSTKWNSRNIHKKQKGSFRVTIKPINECRYLFFSYVPVFLPRRKQIAMNLINQTTYNTRLKNIFACIIE